MAIRVMACRMGIVRPGHNRPLLAVMEWGRREAANRGWKFRFKAYTTLGGLQAINVYLYIQTPDHC